LEPGRSADLVVLSEDPRSAADRLADLRVERTFVGGCCVYRREEASCE
jgi:predicted amidohydrolase YtcJ